jgi:hypothetical protein
LLGKSTILRSAFPAFEAELATFSLVPLFLVPMAVRRRRHSTQPAPHETARPGIAQDFLGWLRPLARQLPLHVEEQFQGHDARL